MLTPSIAILSEVIQVIHKREPTHDDDATSFTEHAQPHVQLKAA